MTLDAGGTNLVFGAIRGNVEVAGPVTLASERQNLDKCLATISEGISDYCRTVRSVDDQVGRVLDYLDEKGLTDNTIVIYTSDQGFLLGEHGLYDKRFMYEESFRTPLIISWPGRTAKGRESAELVQNIDLAPTVLDAAGVEIPEDMDGVSLIPLFGNGKAHKWRDCLYYHFYDYPAVGNVRKHYGIRTGRYKLIHWYGEGYNGDEDIDHWELYDLKKDPHEIRNLAGERSHSKQERKLRARLDQLRKEIGVRE